MNSSQENSIEMFKGITNLPDEICRTLLTQSGWDFEKAVSKFFEEQDSYDAKPNQPHANEHLPKPIPTQTKKPEQKNLSQSEQLDAIKASVSKIIFKTADLKKIQNSAQKNLAVAQMEEDLMQQMLKCDDFQGLDLELRAVRKGIVLQIQGHQTLLDELKF